MRVLCISDRILNYTKSVSCVCTMPVAVLLLYPNHNNYYSGKVLRSPIFAVSQMIDYNIYSLIQLQNQGIVVSQCWDADVHQLWESLWNNTINSRCHVRSSQSFSPEGRMITCLLSSIKETFGRTAS